MTRLGVLADVHANEQALDAVLTHLEAAGVEAFACAGDLVGYGASPDACVRRTLGLPGIAVAGNHELMVLSRLETDRCTPAARASVHWTRASMATDTRAAIAKLPLRRRGPGGLVVAHGSLSDPQRYLRTESEAATELARLALTEPDASVLVVGHTHEPLAVSERRGTLLAGGRGTVTWAPDERVLLNPGAVGQARGGAARARAMVLDLDARSATFVALRYDVRSCRRTLRAAGLPRDACHVRDRWTARGRRLLARAAR